MRSKSFDKIPLGLIIGLLTPVLGFICYGVFWAMRFNKTFEYFAVDLFLGIPTFRSSILSLSLLFNLIPFLLFIRTERYKSARGVMLAVFAYVPFVVYYYFS
jgi:hypothetical protein